MRIPRVDQTLWMCNGCNDYKDLYKKKQLYHKQKGGDCGNEEYSPNPNKQL